MVVGDLDAGKSILRQDINGTIGFIKLGADLERSPKVLMRMFSPSGNPQARNLFEIIAYLQKSTVAVSAPQIKSAGAFLGPARALVTRVERHCAFVSGRIP